MTEPGDFYEDDEPIEKVREDWRRGEPGLTKGPRDLNRRGRAAVEAVIARWDAPETDEAGLPVVEMTSATVASVTMAHNVFRASGFRVKEPAVKLPG